MVSISEDKHHLLNIYIYIYDPIGRCGIDLNEFTTMDHRLSSRTISDAAQAAGAPPRPRPRCSPILPIVVVVVVVFSSHTRYCPGRPRTFHWQRMLRMVRTMHTVPSHALSSVTARPCTFRAVARGTSRYPSMPYTCHVCSNHTTSTMKLVDPSPSGRRRCRYRYYCRRRRRRCKSRSNPHVAARR